MVAGQCRKHCDLPDPVHDCGRNDVPEPILPGRELAALLGDCVATSVKVDTFLYRFDANLPTTAALPGNTPLFVSIASSSSFVWGRASDTAAGGRANLSDSYNTATGGNTLQGVDLAWALDDTPFVIAVPEPASLAVLGFGAVAMLARRVRRGA